MATDPLIRIDMFGGLHARIGDQVISRFSGQKPAALLAYLAYFPDSHPRESLADLLWPDSESEAGRSSLSQALSTLRRQLVPPGVRAGEIFIATKAHVALNPSAIGTDVATFQAALRRGRVGANRIDRMQALQEATDLYRGELLPGFYDEWVQTEQRRLAELYFQAVENLAALREEEGDLLQAIESAQRAVAIDPLREASHILVMRLCSSAGRSVEGIRQYEELTRILEVELGARPSATARRLADDLRRQNDEALPPIRRRAPKQRSNGTLPRGAVTFLFTDIAESTALWEKEGEAFQAALANHHRVLRRLFTQHSGHEVKEAGDSFLVAFESPSSALACAIAAQQALSAQQPWNGTAPVPFSLTTYQSPLTLTVRMALHTGEVKLEDGEYHGPTLHRAGRMLTAAHGGQILCAESLSSIVRRDLPPGVRLVDLGVYRLRDVQAPERIFQVNYDGMPRTDFPRLNAESGYQSNLPLQFTRFFGREEQLAQLSEMLQAGDTRLVTVTGTGGTGKTRLALESGNRMLEPFAGAVWFVPLVDLSDPRLIAGAIVDSLRIARSPTADPLDQAVEALNRQPSLLILDNLEQFVEEGGRIVQTLLERVPLLTCLVTSRQSLSVSGEREYLLAPLATPNGPGTPERLTMFESVRLFIDRAQAVRPDFQVTTQNAPAVAELCDRLEGIPLAIELAAARASVFSPAQMLLQLERRFEFLVSRRPRSTAGRHETLRAAMDWSYDLLSPEIQRFFTRLSVFRGGWTVEAAEAVCEDPFAMEHLTQLRDCSLILAEEGPEGIRFRMLVTLRDYAEERLSPDEVESLRRRHTEFFLNVAQECARKRADSDIAGAIQQFESEHDNMRAVSDHCCYDLQAGEAGLALSSALKMFWIHRGYVIEGRERCMAALAHPGVQEPSRLRALALGTAGALATRHRDYNAGRLACEQSLEIWRGLEDRRGIASAKHSLGIIASNLQDFEMARSLFKDAIAIYQEFGQVRAELSARFCLASLTARVGDLKAAQSLYEELIEDARRQGFTEFTDTTSLGLVVLWQGGTDRARALFLEALALCRKTGVRSGAPESLEGLAQFSIAIGNAQSAARYFGVAEGLREEYGMPRDPVTEEENRQPRAASREMLGEQEFQRLWEEGGAMTLEQAFEYALQATA